jgi:flagellar hook-associated protein 1
MPGLSHTLDIARRAMAAQQSVLAVIGHNVANTSTAGYSRQVARLVQETPTLGTAQDYGNGVRVADVYRQRDRVLDQELRQDLSDLGRWESRAGRLEMIEGIVNEPSDASVSAAMDEFWNAWSELSSDPDDQTRRAVVREQGRVLTYRMQTMVSRVEQLGQDIDNEISTRVDEFNLLLSDLQNLNTMVKESTLQGEAANDLRDRRDLLLDQLTQLADVTYGEREDGVLYVRLDHTMILDEAQYRPLGIQTSQNERGQRQVHIVLPTGESPEVDSGEIGGLIELRQETLPEFLEQLDSLAVSLIDEVNNLHRAGPSGVDFFYGTGARDIAVAAQVEANLGSINTSTSGLVGDNDIALAITQLRDARVLQSGTISLRDYWSNVVGRLGISSREATFQKDSLTVTSQTLQTRRSSESGVSLDEELATLLSAQQAYLGAVRVFQAAEDMMDTLMNI